MIQILTAVKPDETSGGLIQRHTETPETLMGTWCFLSGERHVTEIQAAGVSEEETFIQSLQGETDYSLWYCPVTNVIEAI